MTAPTCEIGLYIVTIPNCKTSESQDVWLAPNITRKVMHDDAMRIIRKHTDFSYARTILKALAILMMSHQARSPEDTGTELYASSEYMARGWEIYVLLLIRSPRLA